RANLIAWHTVKPDTYPWRRGHSPWHVLLAEMCLQRTRPDQLQHAFERLLTLAPNPQSLLVNSAEVRELLGSLGLHGSVDNIMRVAKVLVERFGGVIPETRDGLLSLPGVGDYLSNAVLCFGFGRPAVLMNMNTERIVSRLTGRDGSAKRWQLRLDLYGHAGPAGARAGFNHALACLGR